MSFGNMWRIRPTVKSFRDAGSVVHLQRRRYRRAQGGRQGFSGFLIELKPALGGIYGSKSEIRPADVQCFRAL
jgi:hypothetical protein